MIFVRIALLAAYALSLPFFQLILSVGLFDTHIAVAFSDTLFNVPLAVLILEGFLHGIVIWFVRNCIARGVALGRAHDRSGLTRTHEETQKRTSADGSRA